MAISRAQQARQQYGLGSLVKKITKPIKKIVKSPLGKAAILGIAGFGLPTAAGQSLFGGLLSPGIQTGIGKFLTENALGKVLRDVGIGTGGGAGLEYLENRNLPASDLTNFFIGLVIDLTKLPNPYCCLACCPLDIAIFLPKF